MKRMISKIGFAAVVMAVIMVFSACGMAKNGQDAKTENSGIVSTELAGEALKDKTEASGNNRHSR